MKLRIFLPVLLLSTFVSLLDVPTAQAGSATWNLNPTSGDWNTAANWTPATIPKAPTDIATFSVSNTTSVSLSANTQVDGLTFDTSASAYTISVTPSIGLTLDGAGMTNSSGISQNFVTTTNGAGRQGVIVFTNSATAGDGTYFTNNPSTKVGAFPGWTQFLSSSSAGNSTTLNKASTVAFTNGGFTFFYNTSTAGHGAFTIEGGLASGATSGEVKFFDTSSAGDGVFLLEGAPVTGAIGGYIEFDETSSAGQATFTTNSGAPSDFNTRGLVTFHDSSDAGNGIFINNGGPAGAFGGVTVFNDTATADSAVLIANGGAGGGGGISFSDDSTGGTCVIKLFWNGSLDLSSHNPPGVKIGSLEGDGEVFLEHNLTIQNDQDVVFSGTIEGTTGSLTKAGSGTLTLSAANTYYEGTTVNSGRLLLRNRFGSATGTGAVQVNGGTLGGTGKVLGTVSLGTATAAAYLAPGVTRKPGQLVIANTLFFGPMARYEVDLASTLPAADEVVAKGVTIMAGATIEIRDASLSVLPSGIVFTIIRNTAAAPINGTFSNLADGSMITVASNTYLASYEGGVGNDLTLTVVP